METTPHTKSADEYRHKAAKLRRTAEAAESERLRQHFLDMAREYDGLAETDEAAARGQ